MSATAWLDEYVERLRAHRIVVPGEMVGCTASEVDAIEKEFGVALPGLYRRILLRFGRSAGRLVDVNEFEFYYDEILDVNRWVRGTGRVQQLPHEACFVILARYREVFQYLENSPRMDDAAVYQLELDEDAPGKPVYASVTAVLEALLQDHLPLH